MRDIDRRRYLAWSRTRAHWRRVELARDLMRRAASMGRLALFTSWGKDSVAMADLAIRELGHIDLVHMATPYSLPGNEETIAYFGERSNVINVESPKTLEEHVAWLRGLGGLAYARHSSGKGAAVKRALGSSIANDLGYKVELLGMRAEESRNRDRLFTMRGLIYTRRDGLTVACPIGRWAHDDVWAWIVANDVPYNRRVYDAETDGETRETIRNAGWLSVRDPGRLVWLRRHFPDQFRMLESAFPVGRET